MVGMVTGLLLAFTRGADPVCESVEACVVVAVDERADKETADAAKSTLAHFPVFSLLAVLDRGVVGGVDAKRAGAALTRSIVTGHGPVTSARDAMRVVELMKAAADSKPPLALEYEFRTRLLWLEHHHREALEACAAHAVLGPACSEYALTTGSSAPAVLDSLWKSFLAARDDSTRHDFLLRLHPELDRRLREHAETQDRAGVTPSRALVREVLACPRDWAGPLVVRWAQRADAAKVLATSLPSPVRELACGTGRLERPPRPIERCPAAPEVAFEALWSAVKIHDEPVRRDVLRFLGQFEAREPPADTHAAILATARSGAEGLEATGLLLPALFATSPEAVRLAVAYIVSPPADARRRGGWAREAIALRPDPFRKAPFACAFAAAAITRLERPPQGREDAEVLSFADDWAREVASDEDVVETAGRDREPDRRADTIAELRRRVRAARCRSVPAAP